MNTEVLRKGVVDLKNWVSVPEFGVHEVKCRQYLETLSPSDLANVRRIVGVVAELNQKFQDADYLRNRNIKYGVIAVGSTVRPEAQRIRFPRDINLRVIGNVPTESPFKYYSISAAIDAFNDEEKNQGRYRMASKIASHYPINTLTRGNIVQWVGLDDQDPSFVLIFRKGLPIHVSISGVDRPDFDSHLKEERKQGGRFSVLLNGETESRNLYWEPARALKNRIDGRMTPKAKAAATNGLSKVRDGLREHDSLQVYQGFIECLSIYAYGECAFTNGTTKIINWDSPPLINTPEHRYLTVLSNLGESLRQGESNRTRQILKGLTAIYGSRGDSGGPPCNPEVLSTIGLVVTGIAPLVEAGKLDMAGKTLKSDWDYQIMQIVNSFSSGDRELISAFLFEFIHSTGQFLKREKIKLFDGLATDIAFIVLSSP